MKDHGAIALVGSGEYLPVMQELETELLHFGMSRGKSNTFVQIPTGAGQEGAERLGFWRERGAQQAKRMGTTAQFLPVLTREDAHNPEYISQVLNAGLIYFSGGDPGNITDVFSQTPLWEAVQRAWQDGSSLAGCSAGAMAFGSKIVGIRRMHVTEGLGLLPDIEVIPHYDKMLGWLPDRVTSFIARIGADSTLVGIDENTALVRDNNKWSVTGVGKVHLLRGVLEID